MEAKKEEETKKPIISVSELNILEKKSIMEIYVIIIILKM